MSNKKKDFFNSPDYEEEFIPIDDYPNILPGKYMIMEGKTNYDILHEFGFNEPSEDKRFYNQIIQERAKCKSIAQRLGKARQPD